MLEFLTELLPLLIPVLALVIGLVVLGGILIVQPLVKAITTLADAQGQRLAGQEDDPRQIEQRMVALERALHALQEEREFARGWHGGGDPVGVAFEARELVRET